MRTRWRRSPPGAAGPWIRIRYRDETYETGAEFTLSG